MARNICIITVVSPKITAKTHRQQPLLSLLTIDNGKKLEKIMIYQFI